MARDRVVLVGVAVPSVPLNRVEEHLDELADLVDTAGGTVALRVVQDRENLDPATCIGRGKVDELAQRCKEDALTLVVFDDDLTPAQARNLEKAFGVRVSDRTGVILDIFARRARTREAMTQVALAQYNYLLPRLTRAWTHLSRQAGGIGTRGVGETQLETDRRVIRTRIRHLKGELERIASHRRTQRRRRRRSLEAALVGYTNVGKSSLMNRLAAADVAVEDRLFSTLDTTYRGLHLEGFTQEILLSDTVGLVRKLPHHLVASFRSTLEQAAQADLLLHVVDVSHPSFEEQARTALSVLADLDLGEIPTLTLFNKADRAPRPVLERAASLFPESIPVSALTGEGVEELKARMARAFTEILGGIVLLVPHEAWPGAQAALATVRILRTTYGTEGVRVTVQASEEELSTLLSDLGTDVSRV